MIIRMVLVYVLTTIPFSSCFAEETVEIRSGEKAPFGGILFSNEKANEVFRKLTEIETTQKINESLVKSLKLSEDINNINQTKFNLLLNQNDKLAKNLHDERTVNNWERALWVGVGILAAGVGALALKSATK